MADKKIALEASEARNSDFISEGTVTSYKKFYENIALRQFNKCSYLNCSNNADIVGHLDVKGQPRDFHYMAPICNSCKNNDDGSYLPMKKDIVYVKMDRDTSQDNEPEGKYSDDDEDRNSDDDEE